MGSVDVVVDSTRKPPAKDRPSERKSVLATILRDGKSLAKCTSANVDIYGRKS